MYLHGTKNNVDGYRLYTQYTVKESSTALSNKFYSVSWSDYQSDSSRQMAWVAVAQADLGYFYVTVPDPAITNATEFKTWFSNNNTIFYYVLATATDTQITDSTLIGQLNAIHEWLTRYGYNATVSGNLPLVINQTNLA